MGGKTVATLSDGFLEIKNGGGFALFPTPVDSEKLHVFQQIQTLSPQSYSINDFDYYGSISDFTGKAFDGFGKLPLPESVTSQMANVTEEITAGLATHLDPTETDAWITIRFQPTSHAFDTPRWHIDGKMFTDGTVPKIQYKIGGALFGPGTLFYDIPPEKRHSFAEETTDPGIQFYNGLVAGKDPNVLNEEWLNARKLVDKKVPQENIVQGSSEFMAVFAVGDPGTSGFHSEPNMSSSGNRMFFSMVPGTKSQIEELRQKFEQHNPNTKKTNRM